MLSDLRERPRIGDHQACRLCGDTEPFHVHDEANGVRIEDYFTVGRGQTDFTAAQAWKRRAKDAEARVASLKAALHDVADYAGGCRAVGSSAAQRAELLPNADDLD